MRTCLPLILLLSACGPAPTDPGPGGVSVEDAKALDEAAARLEEEQADPPTLADQVNQ
ncbi:hypothetical protein [Sphingorhabdus sp.]|jgi:hypothetical protein|uniref:hypothetical protein n=1 Tax=Sphingorhabdus sp. TaxID=1902408 RepID=UPI002CD61DA7|nr:hypothetical protein [Sphingorhabdus sp.]HMT41856.1 hypothetical protein [Sphingorhabdus sp.]